jgi:hypothetical protein
MTWGSSRMLLGRRGGTVDVRRETADPGGGHGSSRFP